MLFFYFWMWLLYDNFGGAYHRIITPQGVDRWLIILHWMYKQILLCFMTHHTSVQMCIILAQRRDLKILASLCECQWPLVKSRVGSGVCPFTFRLQCKFVDTRNQILVIYLLRIWANTNHLCQITIFMPQM